MTAVKKPFDLSDSYWNGLSARDQALYGLVRPMPTAAYTSDWIISGLEKTLERMEADQREAGGSFELEPDCWRRLNIDPPCRSNIDPGRVADSGISNCG
jgi:hypothetical protein